MLDVIQDKWSAVVSLTRYTRSAPAAMLLVAAYFQQQQRGEGVYFPWGEKQIGAEVGIKRRTILTARRLLRQLKLIDWDASAGQRALYVVNTELVAKVLGAVPNAPAETPNPARSEPARSARTQPARSARTQPARIARSSSEDAPANPTNPARIATVPENDAPAEEADPARVTLGPTQPPPADSTNPARNDPPRPPGTRYSSFSTTNTRYAGAAPAQASPDSSETKTEEAAEQSAGAALLKRCGLTAKQISAAAARYTSEQITQAVDRVRALRREGRCHKPVAMLAHLLKTGDWPAPTDTSAFDEAPSTQVHPVHPGMPYLPPMRNWQTMQEREAEISAYRQSRPPMDPFFAAILGRPVTQERSALCAGS